jgi:hypothetical protein
MAHKTQTASSASGMVQEVPIEEANGTNKIFSVSGVPMMVISDHNMYREGVGYTYGNGRIVMDQAPKKDIFIVF